MTDHRSSLIADLTHRRLVRLGAGIVIALVIVGVPLFASEFANYQLSLVVVFAVAILGLTVLKGMTGQVSLGQSAFLGVGAYVATYTIGNGWPIPAVIVACAVLPSVIGAIVAIPAVRLRGHQLAIITAALPVLAIPIAKRLSDITGGSDGINVNWGHAPDWSGLADDQWRFYIVAAGAAVLFLFARNVLNGRFGRAFVSVRESESVAGAIGISSYWYKVRAFTLSSFFGGMAGLLFVLVVQYTSPATMEFGVALNMLTLLIVAGASSLLGAIIAGVLYVYLPLL